MSVSFHFLKFCVLSSVLLTGNASVIASPPEQNSAQSAPRLLSYSGTQQKLPELAGNDMAGQLSTQLASMAKDIHETRMCENCDHSLGTWAFQRFRDKLSHDMVREGEELLSPYGKASLALQVDMTGNFTGSGGQILTPWQDKYHYLTFSQIGAWQTKQGLTGNAGIGQRWEAGKWLVGYHSFIDRQIDSGLQRISVGTEFRREFLRFSANYYSPLGHWRDDSESSQYARMARGYDITTQGYLPFYRQLGLSFKWEQYLGTGIDLFDNGKAYSNPVAVQLGINYTPVPLITLSASHKEGEGGQSQNQVGINLNYRPGVALKKQLSLDNIDDTYSLRGDRYDMVERNRIPVLALRQRKTLSVFLATPPWQVHEGETIPLKLQILNSGKKITRLSWQGDTQALSLTSPKNSASPTGWTVIMPAWNSDPDASNEYHLAVTVEDSQQQRVTSNWITLKLVEPMTLQDNLKNHLDFKE